MSEEEAKFFLSGNDQFDLDTFKQVGYVLLKPYLDLEVAQDVTETTDAPAQTDEIPEPLTEELTPPTPEDPQVYDPWRKNQAAEEVCILSSFDQP